MLARWIKCNDPSVLCVNGTPIRNDIDPVQCKQYQHKFERALFSFFASFLVFWRSSSTRMSLPRICPQTLSISREKEPAQTRTPS